MKKNLTHILSLLLVLVILLGAFAACTPEEDDTESNTQGFETDTVASGSESSDETKTETVYETESVSETESDAIELSGEHAATIELANSLKNKVAAYFPNQARDNVVYENMNMSLDYALDVTMPQQVTSLKNKKGNAYVENTMDVFVKMSNGSRYYAKDSYTNGVPNIYRLGYYFYEMRVEGQTFMASATPTDSQEVNHLAPSAQNGIKKAKKNDGVLYVTNNDSAKDPNIIFSRGISADASIYTVLEFTMKADANAEKAADIFFIAGDRTDFNNEQRVRISISNDGKYHTYRVPLYMGDDYTGTVKGLRFDIGGAGANYEISGIRFISVDANGAPVGLNLCRIFNVYSDKMHQVVQIAASSEVSNIEEIGIQTKIDADRVAKLVIKDKSEEIHTSLEGVDWSTVEYVGFDIVNAGIFGYILPYDGKGGSIRIELANGEYIVEQFMAPQNGTIIPSRTTYNSEKNYYNWVSGGNTNDFYIGSRVYTDDNHDFDEFLYEAYCERNPLSENRIRINEIYSSDSSFAGYDSLRGIYRFNMSGVKGGFSEPYYSSPNKHYRTSFIIRGDIDRNVYVMTYTSSGQLECAALLDENDVMLPVPLEVGKNFNEETGERNIYNLADAPYGEVIFPLAIKEDGRHEYTILNLYQNWGKYPLKQLSWIQFFSPYYHLSTGVTETNCLLPWMFTDRTWYNTLPDHRAMSAPLWAGQPQHTYAGDHDWLRYVDADGNVVRWENVRNTIDSYGPTYADVKMDYLTYDGKMKVSYTHSEMPQTDENRTYYEMTYEVLEDITINNFVTDFQLYKVTPNDNTGLYQKVGYLNEQNESVVVEANKTSTPIKYVLGDNCPYFSFFDMDNHSYSNGYANLAFLVYNSDFVIGGETAKPDFAIVNYDNAVYVTLNIEEKTTLKAGDRFTINAILLPWGSQLLDDGIVDESENNYEYTMELPDGSLYMDKNVRDVRENTLLSPIKAIAGENAETVESVFIPKVKTINGESAEFTLTGGYNNVTVRVYGFNKMTVPVIYEKINGEWQEYGVSSNDAKKTPHAYDGYCIHYDGDGTFSYSFVTTMDGENDRTFKIVVDGNYEGWRKEVASRKNPDYLNVYIDSEEIAEIISDETEFFSSAEISEGSSYVTVSPTVNCQYGESYATIYKDSSYEAESGQYLVIKYRVPAGNAEKLNNFDIYISTVNKNMSKHDNLSFSPIQDGKWHVAILDISKFNHPSFTEADGKYCCKYIRFDLFNKKHAESVKLDIAYIGMDSSLEEICKLNQQEFSELPIYAGALVGSIDTYTYETYFDVIVSPDADIKISSLPFGSALDSVNGVKQSINVGSKEGGPKDTVTVSVDADLGLMLKGWCIVGGGVEKYVWSADGGLTWNDCGNLDALGSAPENYLGVAKALSSSKGYEDIEASLRNASFQSDRAISVDLSAYEGETVSVIIAAVPASEPDSLCLLYRFKDITISTQE